MNKSSINFFREGTSFKPRSVRALRHWIHETAANEKQNLGELNFIFSSDQYLLRINQKFLDHDTYTDIITFDNSTNNENICGDVFISMDRVKENAKVFKVSFTDELHRVMIHGVLHLLGFSDKNEPDKKQMTEKEDFYLAKRTFV